MNQRKQRSPLDAHAADLNAWLTPATQGGEGISALEAVKRLAALGVKTSDSSISRWWKATAPDRMIARITSGKEACDQLEAQFKDGGAKVSTLIEWVKNLVAQQAARGEEPDVDQVVAMLRPVLDWSKLELKSREVHVAESRERRESCRLFVEWMADKRAREIADGNASNSDKIEQLGQLMFGEDWKDE